MKRLISCIFVLATLSSCFGPTKPPLTAGLTVGRSQEQGGGYTAAASSYEIVLVRIIGEDSKPQPLAGEKLFIWDSLKYKGIEVTTDGNGSVQFNCRCKPAIYYKDVLVVGKSQQDDDRTNLTHILVEVK